MIKTRLQASQTWVFDLDNTLYPAQCDLFSQIDKRMTRFVSELLDLHPEQARSLQKQYYLEHGTTLNGLMHHHGLAPEAFLKYVHDIDHSVLPDSPQLRRAIEALPGRKLIFTNGSKGHANSVTKALGLDGIFDGVVDIIDTGFTPKPQLPAYDHLVESFDVDPNRSVLFEDLARNLLPAHQMGFVTVLVTSDKDWSHEPEGARPATSGDTHDHVHFSTDDLSGFLTELLEDI
jgi:putative hydrolase of the HAD superfamily